MARNSRSIGEMISTLCFAGMTGWFVLSALEEDRGWMVAVLWLSALACALGAARFPLQALVDHLRR